MHQNEKAIEQVIAGIQQQGYLIDLNVSQWAGQARLSEADLGVEGLTDVKLHRLGRRQIVPAEEIAKITKFGVRARARLAHVSYAFPIGNARFVPVKVLGNLLADLSAIRTQFLAAVDKFCADYDKIATECREEWRKNAAQIKAELNKDDEWLASFEARLESAYPPVEKVRKAFDMEWSLFQFALPKGLHTKLVSAGQAVQAAKLAEEARAKLSAKVADFVGEAALELRQRCAELCTHVAKQVAGSGEKISERTLEPLRDLIQQFKEIDFTGDSEFAAELDKLQANWIGATKEAGVAKTAREDADYRKAMGDALTALANKAVADTEAVAQEALERFLNVGTAGRRVVVDDDDTEGSGEGATTPATH